MIGALVFMNPGGKKLSRPVAVRRSRTRSRTARTTGKESQMARTRSRRRTGRRMRRNAKGHFVARSRTRSRRRRNPSGFIKVGRRWKKMTKYASRRRRGRRKGQISGFHFPKRYRRTHRRRRVRSNPVVVANPRRRRRVRRNPYRRYHRVRRNPAASYRLSSDPIAAIKNAVMSAFSVDTLETLAEMGVGFGGSLFFGKWLYQQPWVPATAGSASLVKVGSTFVSSVLLTGLSAFLKKPALSARVLTGGLFATLWQAVSEAISGTQYAQFVPTLSGADSDQFRKAIEAEVLKELRGGGMKGYLRSAGSEGVATYLQPAGIEYIPAAGSEAYLTEVNTERAQAGMGAYLTEVNTERAQAGLGHNDDEFSRRGMSEQF